MATTTVAATATLAATPAHMATATATAHAFEIVAPVYEDVIALLPRQSNRAEGAVTVESTADNWLMLVFQQDTKTVKKDVACVNHNHGCCCAYVPLLRALLLLRATETLVMRFSYVVRWPPATIDTPPPPPRPATSATIRVHVELHAHAGRQTPALSEFELVLSHLHPALMLVLPSEGRSNARWQHCASVESEHDVDHLIDAARTTRCHVVGCRLHPDGETPRKAKEQAKQRAKLRLADVFHSLTTPPEANRMAVRDDTTYVERMKRPKRQLILTDLPTNALQAIVCLMDARNLAALSAACSMFQHMAYEVVPGLQLKLYRHQQRALKWMLYREATAARELVGVPHPFIFPAHASPGVDKCLDLVDMKVLRHATPTARDIHGGMFCDEPGLGKTITMLSLILRTKGQRSSVALLGKRHEQAQKNRGLTLSLRSAQSRGRDVHHGQLVESSASLIIVPNPLIEHWKYQIVMQTLPGSLKVYINEQAKFPPPEELALYDIVITSFGRLTTEWRYHRPGSALEERMPERYGFEGQARYIDGQERGDVSSLLRIHWVRVIVDEGHKLGGSSESNQMRMARLFNAEKRWVMTGTPTPNTLQSADLRHLHGLLVFLRDVPFGQPDGKAWTKAIAKPFELDEKTGFIRLQHLLTRIMIRHTKDSINETLPPPIRRTVLIDPTSKEYAVYNAVAAAVRANLVITNVDPHYPGRLHLDSLLNPINRKYAMQVTNNLRLACCGGGEMTVFLTRKNYVETVQYLHELGVEAATMAEAIEFLRKAQQQGMQSYCGDCKRNLQLLMLLPCGHMACADCVETRIETVGPSCFRCQAVYDVELFQKLQPGFDFMWADDDPKTATTAMNEALVGANNGRFVDLTVHNEDPQRARRGRQANGSTNTILPGRGRRRALDMAKDFELVEASKAFYVAKRVLELRNEFAEANQKQEEQHWNRTTDRQRYVKAIVFSQFKEHIWRMKVAFAQHGVPCADFMSGRSPAFRMQELHKFRSHADTSVLLMTDIGSHGLDLSFVTHIFLLEEIWDKSLEQQVISRAHRMGAKQSVIVEQLVMRGTVEMTMMDYFKRDPPTIPSPDKGNLIDNEKANSPKPTSSPRKTSEIGALGTFVGANKRGKNHHHHKKMASKGDTMSLVHQQLYYVLNNLRLLDTTTVAGDREVRFAVLDEEGRLLRRATHQLPSQQSSSGNVAIPRPSNLERAGNGRNQSQITGQSTVSSHAPSSVPRRGVRFATSEDAADS